MVALLDGISQVGLSWRPREQTGCFYSRDRQGQKNSLDKRPTGKTKGMEDNMNIAKIDQSIHEFVQASKAALDWWHYEIPKEEQQCEPHWVPLMRNALDNIRERGWNTESNS